VWAWDFSFSNSEQSAAPTFVYAGVVGRTNCGTVKCDYLAVLIPMNWKGFTKPWEAPTMINIIFSNFFG
jgi:hypothetical protein